MTALKGKKIIIGVAGSIAAYKVAHLVRLLVKQEAEVKVIMTTSATSFISPLTLATLSKNPVLTEFVQDDTGVWNNHVELGLWADAMLIAPATSNTLAKCATGLTDNLLVATYLSARCPVFFAPAMDLDMYLHPATRNNLARLAQYGNQIIPAETGELASGLVGQGRMAEPEHIVNFLEKYWPQPLTWKGKRVLITAGPTQEALDPVRYLTNHSTGKMGYAIAEAALKKGAKVTLVSGPTQLHLQHENLDLIAVKSAQAMYEACAKHFEQADITILSAAVADYTPEIISDKKIKKEEGATGLVLQLKRTVDIAHTLGQQKKAHQILVGFALETDNELQNAQAKLIKKNFDLIVLNSLREDGAGFGHDTNKVFILDQYGEIVELPLLSKQEVAEKICQKIELFENEHSKKSEK